MEVPAVSINATEAAKPKAALRVLFMLPLLLASSPIDVRIFAFRALFLGSAADRSATDLTATLARSTPEVNFESVSSLCQKVMDRFLDAERKPDLNPTGTVRDRTACAHPRRSVSASVAISVRR
jgi:hypothetical protein